jgi:hypothetical protein
MALALSGMPPTCQGFGDAMADTVIGSHISKTEDALGAGLWGAARTLMPLPVLGEVRR